MLKINYTPETLNTIKSMYEQLGNEGLEKIALAVDKPITSIRSKLVKEGLYKKADKPTKTLKELSKKEICRELELKGIPSKGLEGATKEALSTLLQILSK